MYKTLEKYKKTQSIHEFKNAKSTKMQILYQIIENVSWDRGLLKNSSIII